MDEIGNAAGPDDASAAPPPPGKDGRSLARSVLGGAGTLGIAGAASRVFSLVTAPVLTRLLGPAPYGTVALLSTVMAFATTLSLLGIDSSYSRYFFSGNGGRRDAVERFCWRFSIVSSVLVASAAGAGWMLLGPRFGLAPEFALMVSAGVILSVAGGMGTTMRRLRGAYPRIAVSIVASGGIGALVSIAMALFVRKDAWALLAGTACGLVSAAAILGMPSPGILARRSGLTVKERVEILRLGITVAYIAPVYWLIGSVDRWFLAEWHGQGEVGIYSFAAGIAMTGILVNSAVTLAWFPEMTRVYEHSPDEAPGQLGRMWSRLAGILLVTWLAVTAAGGDVIRILADHRFHSGVVCVPWLAGGVFFYGICSLANTGLLLRKDLKPVVGWWTAAAAANIALNALLVEKHGAAGSAIAACACYALVSAGVMWSAQKRIRLPIDWVRLSMAGAVSLAAGMAMFPQWTGSPASSLLLKFPVGLACVAILAGLLAPDWLRRFLDAFLPGRGGPA